MKLRNHLKTHFSICLLLLMGLGLAACGNTLQIGKPSYDRLHIPITDNETGSFNVNLLARHAAIEVRSESSMKLSILEGTVFYNNPQLHPNVNYNGYGAQVREKLYREDLPDEAENLWSFSMGRKVPLNLNVGAGTAKSTFDLGGVPIKTLNFKEGGEGTRIFFSKPNPISLEEMIAKTARTIFSWPGWARPI